jgi:hypothetical protein
VGEEIMLKDLNRIEDVTKGAIIELSDLESRVSLIYDSAKELGLDKGSMDTLDLSKKDIEASMQWLGKFLKRTTSKDTSPVCTKKIMIQESLCNIETSIRNIRYNVSNDDDVEKNLEFILDKVKNINELLKDEE